VSNTYAMTLHKLVATIISVAIAAGIAEAQVPLDPPAPQMDPDLASPAPPAVNLLAHPLQRDDRLIRCERAIGAAACAWDRYWHRDPSPPLDPTGRSIGR
jgi:hypothetical protein